MSFLLLFQNVLHFAGWDYMIFMLNHVESGERCCFGWPAVSFFSPLQCLHCLPIPLHFLRMLVSLSFVVEFLVFLQILL